MNSIYDHIQGLDQEEWDYYTKRDNQEVQESLSKINDWDDKDEHSHFIKEYLLIAGKLEVIQKFEINKINLKSFERNAHTNSVFFLGCILYKELKLNQRIKFFREDKYDEFYFLLFLSSLVHDFGYHIENCSTNINELSKKITSDIETFKLFFKIENDLLSTEYSLDSNTKILLDNVSSYFKARKEGKLSSDSSGKIDHGIAAGLLLYDSLVRNRICREKSNKEKENNGVETDGLYWGKELEEFYARASSSIATHNMRRCTPKKFKTYLDMGLEKLIINGKDGHVTKLTISDDAFAILFALADTLEPLKIYDSCIDRQIILKSIYIEIKDDEIIFENKNPQLDFKPFIDNAKSLESWVDIDIEQVGSNQIKLIISD
jgi:hypothetical protein